MIIEHTGRRDFGPTPEPSSEDFEKAATLLDDSQNLSLTDERGIKWNERFSISRRSENEIMLNLAILREAHHSEWPDKAITLIRSIEDGAPVITVKDSSGWQNEILGALRRVQ